MEANELMVGDWVLWKNKKVQIARVGGIVYSFGHIDVTLAHCNDEGLLETHDIKSISPIPLTEEILKNNFPDPTDGLTWFPEEGGFNCHTYVPKCEINAFGLFKYVHQLQNALRLCGIDIDIKL